MESYQKELVKIKEILKENSRGMTVTDISRKIHTNRNSVAKYLDILLISGQAEMVTFGPAKVFFPSRRIPLSTLLNFTSDNIALIDKNHTILQANDNFSELINLKPEEIIGQPITTITSSVFPIPEIIHHIQKALEGKDTTIETNLQKKEEKLYLRIKYIPTTFDNGEPGVTLIIENTTDQTTTLKKMQHLNTEWETTFNAINDMISIHDTDYIIRKANKAFADFFNQSIDEIIGKKCYEVLHGTKKTYTSCPCKQIQRLKKATTVEFFEPHLEKRLEISASPIFDKNGEISGSVHIIKDITDKKSRKI